MPGRLVQGPTGVAPSMEKPSGVLSYAKTPPRPPPVSALPTAASFLPRKTAEEGAQEGQQEKEGSGRWTSLPQKSQAAQQHKVHVSLTVSPWLSGGFFSTCLVSTLATMSNSMITMPQIPRFASEILQPCSSKTPEMK